MRPLPDAAGARDARPGAMATPGTLAAPPSPAAARPARRALALRLAPAIPWLLALLAFAHASFYALAVPPFDSPDESSHYEYARAIHDLGRLPGRAEVPEQLHDEIVAAMRRERTGIWRLDERGQRQLVMGSEIGSQPPLYYAVAAQFLRLPGLDADHLAALRAIRLLSALLAAATVALTYLAARRLFPDEPSVHFGAPLLLLALPGFLFIGGSANNDNLAIVAFAALLASLVALLAPTTRSRRETLLLWAAALAAAALALAAKRSTAATVPILAAGALLYAWPVLRARVSPPWRVAAALALVAALASFWLWGLADRDARGWIKHYMTAPSYAAAGGLLGSTAIAIDDHERPRWAAVSQSLPPAHVAALRGKLVQLGAWVRVHDGGPRVARITLSDGRTELPIGMLAEDEWRWVTLLWQVPADATTMIATLSIGSAPAPGAVLFDGVVLTAGTRPGQPTFDDETATAGTWAGDRFVNLLANPSGIERTRAVRDALRPILGVANLEPAIADAVLDLERYQVSQLPLYRRMARFVFESFWWKLGWQAIHLPQRVYDALLGFTALAGLGLVVYVVRRWRAPARFEGRGPALLLLLIAALLVVAVALAPYVARYFPPGELPQGRYLYTALLPLAIGVALGLRQLLPRRLALPALAILTLALLALEAWAFLRIALPVYAARGPIQ